MVTESALIYVILLCLISGTGFGSPRTNYRFMCRSAARTISEAFHRKCAGKRFQSPHGEAVS